MFFWQSLLIQVPSGCSLLCGGLPLFQETTLLLFEPAQSATDLISKLMENLPSPHTSIISPDFTVRPDPPYIELNTNLKLNKNLNTLGNVNIGGDVDIFNESSVCGVFIKNVKLQFEHIQVRHCLQFTHVPKGPTVQRKRVKLSARLVREGASSHTSCL